MERERDRETKTDRQTESERGRERESQMRERKEGGVSAGRICAVAVKGMLRSCNKLLTFSKLGFQIALDTGLHCFFQRSDSVELVDD